LCGTTETKKLILEVLETRDRYKLFKIIGKHVKPGSTLITDGLESL